MNNSLNRASNVRKYYFISFKLQSKNEITESIAKYFLMELYYKNVFEYS